VSTCGDDRFVHCVATKFPQFTECDVINNLKIIAIKDKNKIFIFTFLLQRIYFIGITEILKSLLIFFSRIT